MTIDALITFDGTNVPVVIGSDAPPDATDDPRWTLSSVELAGVTLLQNINVSIDFGIRAATEGAMSDIYDSRVFVETVAPKITVSGTKLGEAIDLAGSDGAVSVVFRKRLSGGTFDLPTLAISGTGLATFTNPFAASGNKRATEAIQAHLVYDGTNNPLTVTYASNVVS